jgi:excisionase family DNA binding protein
MTMANRAEPQRATYTVSEAAALLGVHPTTITRACGRGDFLHVKIGDRLMIPRWWLDDKLLPKPAATPRAESPEDLLRRALEALTRAASV